MVNNFRKDLKVYLDEHLRRESPKYDVVASWCDCISDKNISDRNLDYQIRKIIEMLYNKHQITAKQYFNKMGISRYELRDIIIKVIVLSVILKLFLLAYKSREVSSISSTFIPSLSLSLTRNFLYLSFKSTFMSMLTISVLTISLEPNKFFILSNILK